MLHAGHPRDQAIAAALNTARRSATGGAQNSENASTLGKVFSGAIMSPVAGRTDHLPIHVLSGSYVIPADIVSAMGEGNTAAGFKVAKAIFTSPQQRYPSADSETIPVIVAGGEFILTPDDVIRIGEGSMEDGHKILDEFVKAYRAKTIETLKKLPGPKQN